MNSDMNDEYFSYSYFHNYVNIEPYGISLLGQTCIEGLTDFIASWCLLSYGHFPNS